MVVKNRLDSIKKVTDEKKQLNEIVDLDDKFTINVAQATDYREKTKAAYNRVYYISDGEMVLRINDQELQLRKGDACYVEKGTIVELEGSFNVIIVSQPVLRL